MIFYLHRDVSRLWPGSQGKSGLTSIHSVFLWTWPLFFSIFFFFTLIQDFSIKIVFTCCNSISYSTDRATFTFSRGKSSRLYRISDCVSSSFVNGMNSSYFFSFFPPFSMKFYFQFNSGTGDQTEKKSCLSSFLQFVFFCPLCVYIPLPCKFLNLILIRTGFTPSKKEKFLFKLLLRGESLVSR